MAGNRVTMTEGSLLGVLLRVALPISAANIAQSVHHIVNAWFVGRLGEEAIAAVAASGPLFGVLMSLGSGLATAGAVLVAQNSGAGNAQGANHSAAQSLVMVVIVAILFALAGAALAPATLRLIGIEQSVFDLAWQYLTISYAGLMPMFAFMVIQIMLQSAGEVRFAMLVMIGSVVLNALLDPLLIFGIGPWNGLGVPGAALATVIAQFCAFLVVLRHLTNGRSGLHLKRADFRPDLRLLKLALGIGLPASIEQGARTFGSLLLMAIAALFGTASLAAFGMGGRVVFFWFAPMLGLSIATAAVVGQNIGAGRMDRAEQAARLSGWVAFLGFTVIGVLHLPFMRAIMGALAPGAPEVVREATRFGYIVFPFMGILALPQALNGAFRGAGSTRQAMIISLVMQYGVQMPFAWGAALFTSMGVLAIWWSYPVANIFASAIAIFWLLKGPWRKNVADTGGRSD